MSGGRWRDAVAAGAPPDPVVLVLGGFLTSPPIYRALARRLRERGAAEVVVARIWTMDWLLATRRGVGPILTRSARALLDASAQSEALALGAPVLVVGHSAGGVCARLLTSPEPYAGRRLNGSGRIAAVVTLGSPHLVAEPVPGRPGFSVDDTRLGAETAHFANRVVPGAFFAPTTGYLAVGSRYRTGRRDGVFAERRAWRAHHAIAGSDEPSIEGDALVPLASTQLPGASSLVFDDAAHGQGIGHDWYGSDRFVDRWWPLALGVWRAALAARVERERTATAARPMPDFDDLADRD
jgi:hypothetical protein